MTFKALTTAAAIALGLATSAFAAGEGGGKIENIDFSFDGPFGAYDGEQLRRGLKVYTEVCAACHGLQYVPLRTLGDDGGPHYSEDEVRAYAADTFEVFDAGLDDFRPAKPQDNFPANTSVGAPDLSMMAKARAGFHGPAGLGINQFFKVMGGPEYIVALLTGYTGKEKEEAGTVLYENTAFPGGWISMAPPLESEQVDFDDGHANDLYHLSEDTAAFLMWAAEPKLGDRKVVAFRAILILGLLTVLLYLSNKRLWAPVKGRAKGTPAE
jgi:ubiquinol-cytochrome c reductase cytochrome c1 subunit